MEKRPSEQTQCRQEAIEKATKTAGAMMDALVTAERNFKEHFETYDKQLELFLATNGQADSGSQNDLVTFGKEESRKALTAKFDLIYYQTGQYRTREFINAERAFKDAKIAAKNVGAPNYIQQTSDFGTIFGDDDDGNTEILKDFNKKGKRKHIIDWREDKKRGYQRTSSEMHFALSGSPDDNMLDSASAREDDDHWKGKIVNQKEQQELLRKRGFAALIDEETSYPQRQRKSF
jgi:hypothetical protein